MSNAGRYIIVFVILIAAIVAGFYLYSNSKKEQNNSQQTGGHGTTAGGHQPVTQGERTYEPEITSDTANINLNQPTKFSYKIKNDKGGILKNYEVVHEKITHFIVVRKDLQKFLHLHPDFNKATGEFTVDITFPTDGPYRVFPDFTPAEDNPQKQPVTVYHDIDVGDVSEYKAQPVLPDTQPRKTVGEYQITYNFPTEVMMRSEISYGLTLEKNDQPITDLQTYLGALGHSVILKEGTLNFIHTHAGETGTGPKIEFSTTFSESGIYKIFTQFQHQNKVITTDYVLKVN